MRRRVIEDLSLTNWELVRYIFDTIPVTPDAIWILEEEGKAARQLLNGKPSILLSDFIFENSRIEGTMRVSDGDNDNIGFVFGFQNALKYYRVIWRKGDPAEQDQGMRIQLVNLDTPIGEGEIVAFPGSSFVNLYRNFIPWAPEVDYKYVLDVSPGEFTVTVSSEPDGILDSFTLNDSTFTTGRFGFTNDSQANLLYRNLRLGTVSERTYVYDVEATDPDATALSFTLTEAPVGMTIDALSGLISWPLTADNIGQIAPVTVQVEDPEGKSDTQAFTLQVFVNEAPGVDAGPDRYASVGDSTALEGSVTDDGLPERSGLTIEWSQVDGRGIVTFSSPLAPSTLTTFDTAGLYVLELSADDSDLLVSDLVEVRVDSACSVVAPEGLGWGGGRLTGARWIR